MPSEEWRAEYRCQCTLTGPDYTGADDREDDDE